MIHKLANLIDFLEKIWILAILVDLIKKPSQWMSTYWLVEQQKWRDEISTQIETSHRRWKSAEYGHISRPANGTGNPLKIPKKKREV